MRCLLHVKGPSTNTFLPVTGELFCNWKRGRKNLQPHPSPFYFPSTSSRPISYEIAPPPGKISGLVPVSNYHRRVRKTNMAENTCVKMFILLWVLLCALIALRICDAHFVIRSTSVWGTSLVRLESRGSVLNRTIILLCIFQYLEVKFILHECRKCRFRNPTMLKYITFLLARAYRR